MSAAVAAAHPMPWTYDPSTGSWKDADGQQVTQPQRGVIEKTPLHLGSCEAKAIARGATFDRARRACSK